MTGTSGSFADLRDRSLSGLAMAAVGIAAVWAGGLWFTLLVCALCGLMVWELTRMLDQTAPYGKAEGAGLTAAVALLVFWLQLAGLWLLGTLALSVVLLAWRFPRDRGMAAAYLALILFAGLGLIALRDSFGWVWVLWLVLLVIGSDVAGYFAGRVLGGPKLWPRVSPKKTWSGTVAGWILAAIIGAAFMPVLNAGSGLVLASILVAMAGQAGDIGESAIKRHAGVKDSSALIPGHGGVMDRFDAMIAAALMMLVLTEAGLIARLLN
ncbi:phosphatidate cytidylyltransferase [Roseinatronobacter bogoriensis]|uniref:Phosphatidate cytidylyltransferase n=1 Tax=Roseinatronobacter bogoriensis subsp. barguzinensis TaxID=441209 RepID=A0A2K8KAX2_9RHOB|nr:MULTISPECIES: phosphatidate cytidylyltransferase [Rhodobaca]ATX66592.1 phosphatidate cytidylyltransferase [Rhodobaca barguzinensis]MBB4207765.1 phosphatidate cytidylyltransferase [Rhodobaca bogoriensis DSM 18756]TDW39927.1 phosphatidate cytidylyltransferase [Rhodobaca barguzinensis]TDY70919.1 phosphatidate cytidylyltransferase [Rhodobaca bogoriensis DSM 18756]